MWRGASAAARILLSRRSQILTLALDPSYFPVIRPSGGGPCSLSPPTTGPLLISRSEGSRGRERPSRHRQPRRLLGLWARSHPLSSSGLEMSPRLLGTTRSAIGSSPRLGSDSGKLYPLAFIFFSALVVATSGAGFVLGSGNVIDFTALCCTCAGTVMVAASANSLNQVFEVQNDAKMKRTRQRPLPSGRITVLHAALWASSIGLAGTTFLALKVVAGRLLGSGSCRLQSDPVFIYIYSLKTNTSG